MNRDLNPFINDEYDLFQKMMFTNMNSVSSCSIGTIISINSSPVSVDIQPVIKYFDENAGFQTPPILKNIPLAQIASNLASVRIPYNVGDVGVILWFDREVYSWLNSASVGPTEPDSGNLHNESACIFIPLAQKFSKSLPVKNAGMDFVSSGQSLLQQLITLVNSLNTFATALTALSVGDPSTPLTIGNYAIPVTTASTTLITSITSVIASLTLFKGSQ